GLGFTMAIILMSNIIEKLELTPVRKSFKGVPITFISAGIMELEFMSYDTTLLTHLGLV
ncbi:MAG: Rnf-Nqr domain containing protein, partial [Spirochaetales bacterium]|nr:Rnf-Nqr domain containing protein [Spirochaetales bacterium]